MNFSHVDSMVAPWYDVPQGDVTLVNGKVFLAGVPIKEYTSCASVSHVQKYLIFMELDLCCLMVLFAILTVVALLQCTGIFGWIWPRSSRISLKVIPSWQFKNNALSLASAVKATTNCNIEHSVWKALFNLIGLPSCREEPMKIAH